MIALLAAAAFAPDDGGEMAALSKAASGCDRAAMSRAWTGEVKRHSDFLVSGYQEQRALVDGRAVLAERRRKLRTGAPGPGDTPAALALVAADLDDRQRALDDAAALDRMQGEAVGYFRQLYLTQCGGKPL